MSASDDLATLKSNNTADATALTSLEAELNTPATESTGDKVLAAVVPVVTTEGLVAVFGADALSSALTAEGYTVTAPEAPETPGEPTDAEDTAEQVPVTVG